MKKQLLGITGTALLFATGIFMGGQLTSADTTDLPYEYSQNADGTYKITSIGDKSKVPANVTLPEMHNGQPVTELGFEVFKNCDTIETINLSNVKMVWNSCFTWCDNLKSVTGSHVTYLKSCAFSICPELATVQLPNVEDIEYMAFNSDVSLTSVSFPKLKSLGNCVFLNEGKMLDKEGQARSMNLTEFVFPENFTKMELATFNSATNVQTMMKDYIFLGEATAATSFDAQALYMNKTPYEFVNVYAKPSMMNYLGATNNYMDLTTQTNVKVNACILDKELLVGDMTKPPLKDKLNLAPYSNKLTTAHLDNFDPTYTTGARLPVTLSYVVVSGNASLDGDQLITDKNENKVTLKATKTYILGKNTPYSVSAEFTLNR
jgi:hypothetical protein